VVERVSLWLSLYADIDAVSCRNMFWGMDETAMETDTRKKRPHDPDASANKVLAAQEERIKRRRLKGSTSAPPSDDVQ